MLTCISIKKLLYFRDVDINLTDGLNVFTGETGAGKSLIIDAIEFVFGQKGNFEEDSFVELTFEATSEYSEDGVVILSRQIKNGKSIYYLNGRKVVRSLLEEIGQSLIEIHGQHQNQKLFKKEYHRQIFDKSAKLEDMLEDFQKVYTSYKDMYKQVEKLKRLQSERLRTIDIINYQIKELQEADIKPSDKDNLENQYNYLKNIRVITEGISLCQNTLSERVFPDIKIVDKTLSRLANIDSRFEKMYNEFQEAKAILENIFYSFDSFEDYQYTDISQIEERLNRINFLERKYNVHADELVNILANLKSELDRLENIEYELPDKERNLFELEKKVKHLAEEISKKRRDNIKSFSESVVKHLKDLGFSWVNFTVSIDEKPIDLYGKDRLEFLFTSNIDYDLKPLNEIASGGEISRLSLAIKLVSKNSVPTMIFDEVDTGIGGKTALNMAKKLKELSREFQVILITHLPQIAALSDNHYFIEKKNEDGKTIGTVRHLTQEDKVYEIARMLKGDIDNKSIDYAREFIDSLKEENG